MCASTAPRRAFQRAIVTTLRDERPADIDAIANVIRAAFAAKSHTDHQEANIVTRLRQAGALTLSIVVREHETVVGHVAVSPVLVDERHGGWYGLGPVSVHPDAQGKGAGSALVTEALERLMDKKAAGCVVLGRPEFYGRFGFEKCSNKTFVGAPARFFQQLLLAGPDVGGEVTYHHAFDTR